MAALPALLLGAFLRAALSSSGAETSAAEWAPRGGGHRTLTFVNSCPEPLVVVGSEGAFRLAPGAAHALDLGRLPRRNWRWTPYFAPRHGGRHGLGLCPADGCAGWRVTRPAKGWQWMGGKNAHYAAVCNPWLSGRPGVTACCSTASPGYDAAAGNCPGINDGGWGSLFEAMFDAWGGLDFIDFSTNFRFADQGFVFFNIPMSMTSTAPCANSHTQSVAMPWQCLSANCRTAYQSPTDKENNGAQLACSNAASYRIEYCPRGRMPF